MGWTAAPLQRPGHSNYITRAALPFSSNNSFSRSRDGRGMVLAIRGDDWCKSFTWPDARPDAKLSYGTGPLSGDNIYCNLLDRLLQETPALCRQNRGHNLTIIK